MQITNTKKAIWILVLTAFLALAAYGWLVYLIFDERSAADSFREDLAYELDRGEQLRSLARLLEEVAVGRVLISDQFLPENEDAVAAYIATIESLAQHSAASLTVNSVATAGDTENNTRSLAMQLSASGTQGNIMNLTKLIESLPVVTSIDTAQISITSIDGVPQWDARFTLRALVSGS